MRPQGKGQVLTSSLGVYLARLLPQHIAEQRSSDDLKRRTAGSSTVVTIATPPIQKTTAITWIARANVTSSINLFCPCFRSGFRSKRSAQNRTWEPISDREMERLPKSRAGPDTNESLRLALHWADKVLTTSQISPRYADEQYHPKRNQRVNSNHAVRRSMPLSRCTYSNGLPFAPIQGHGAWRSAVPVPRQRAVVLAAVKTKPSAALNRAGLDRRCARRRRDRAAGTGECSAGPNQRM